MITAQKYGPWAVVAGGSEGIGACMARKLAKAGINLVLVARKAKELEDTAHSIRDESTVQVRTLQIDLARADMLDQLRKVTDGLEVGLAIFNAGGIGNMRKFLNQPLEDIVSAIQLNGVSAAAFAHHFAKEMAPRGRGGIILVSSIASTAGMANLATYSGAKAFVHIFGEALWAELKPHGVDVLVLFPPATDTPARKRSGFPGTPGVTPVSADDIAQETLDNLGNGPIYVPPTVMPSFERMRALPRREAAELFAKSVPSKD